MKNKSLLLKRGTCILTETPFVHVLKSKYRTERCDYCFTPGKMLKCSNCQYVYYCNQICQKDAWPMHKIECGYLKKIVPRIVPDAARILSRIILKLKNGGDLIKGYYTETNYRKFRDLMSHYAELKADTKRMEHLESLSSVLSHLLGNELLPNPAELLSIYGRLTTNGFNILDPEMNSIGTGIYLGVSVTDHSCIPNAVVTFEGTRLNLRLTEDIPCLDWSKIFISYVDLLNTPEDRRNDLKANYYFLCICSKCIDPLEPVMMAGAACTNKKCSEPINIQTDCCTKCGAEITDNHRARYNEVMEFTKNHLDNMKEMAYLDICKICLSKQRNILHSLNLWHVKTLDLALESAINVNKWTDALEFGIQLVPGFRKYYGEWNPLLGLLYMKIGKIQANEGLNKEALHNLNEARKIIETTHGTEHSLYKYELIPLLLQSNAAISQ